MREEESPEKTQEILDLLYEFNAEVDALYPGVKGHQKVTKGSTYSQFDCFSFDGPTWSWVRPLLEELRDRRRRE